MSNSFIFGDKKNSENLFIERYYHLLRENGRMGIVLPESVYDTTENKYIRLFIYKYSHKRKQQSKLKNGILNGSTTQKNGED